MTLKLRSIAHQAHKTLLVELVFVEITADIKSDIRAEMTLRISQNRITVNASAVLLDFCRFSNFLFSVALGFPLTSGLLS